MNATYTYDHYYRYGEITEILQKYAAEYPNLVRLNSLGRTPEGRDIWMVELTDTATGSFEDKPAHCVTANIHAGEVTGTMCAMYFLDYLLTNSDEPEVRSLLGKYTVYVIPRITPDGAECYLTTPESLRSVNRMYPYNELMPGLQPRDMDGDGVIRRMRIKSPFGIWKVSPEDPRVMVKRAPDETEGDFYNVYTEGEILDYDGINIKSAPNKWGNDFNRNFPLTWVPEAVQPGGGTYPMCNVETRSLTDFIVGHPNLCTIVNMHTMSGFYLYPPATKSRKEAPKADMERYKTIGKMATEETTYPVISIHDEYCPVDSNDVYGSFDDFTHFARGLFDYTIELWDLNPRAGIPFVFPTPSEIPDEQQAEESIKYLRWIDEHNDGQGFLNWTRFQHPQLGEVEIGGIDYKTVVQNCPAKYLPQEVEKHTRFMLREMKTLPLLKIGKVNVEHIDGSAYRVDAYVMNTGYFPTYVTQEALNLKIVRDIEATLSGEGITFVEGKPKQLLGQLEGFSGIAGFSGGEGAISFEQAPCEKKVTWIIKAAPGSKLTVSAVSERAGRAAAEVVLP